MTEPSIEQIRNFRLRSHHLDAPYPKTAIPGLVGACGMQNSPPGSWETALYNRVPDLTPDDTKRLLYKEKSLLQAWSFRGAPFVFPTSESGTFLSPLIPEPGEPWIYTRGITLALDFLQMEFDELLEIIKQVMPRLDHVTITSKTALDQTIAGWAAPLLPPGKRSLWNQPSMYGNPEVQTVGGAVVSFLLRPCSFCGLVVFGERTGTSPQFTSLKNWTGKTPETAQKTHQENSRDASQKSSRDASRQLVRKYLHCYGPATLDSFTAWLGCSGKQGRRMWNTVSEEIEPVTVLGKKAFILSEDRPQLISGPAPEREAVLLGAHDPYLDQRDRMILQPDQSLHREIWKTVTNPGAVLYRGAITGIWTSRKTPHGIEIKITPWPDSPDKHTLSNLAEQHAHFHQQKLIKVEIHT